MKNLIIDLRQEFVGKEMTLLELDNRIETITGSTSSLFDDLSFTLEANSYSYFIKKGLVISVDFEIVKETEEKTDIVVKITDVWEI